jgi:hypothetical protein
MTITKYLKLGNLIKKGLLKLTVSKVQEPAPNDGLANRAQGGMGQHMAKYM